MASGGIKEVSLDPSDEGLDAGVGKAAGAVCEGGHFFKDGEFARGGRSGATVAAFAGQNQGGFGVFGNLFFVQFGAFIVGARRVKFQLFLKSFEDVGRLVGEAFAVDAKGGVKSFDRG